MMGTQTKLFERNCRAFRRRFPQVWAKLKETGGGATWLVEKDGTVINLALDAETMLYPDAGPDWSRGQMESFRRFPERLILSDPSHCNLSAVSMALLGDLTRYLRDNGMTDRLHGAPVVDVGFLVVFGIGLGWHAQELVRDTPARHIVFIEAFPEFLYQSLFVVDWLAVFRAAERRERTIDFVLSSDPGTITSAVTKVVSDHRITFLDGSYFCAHYYAWAYREALIRCHDELKPISISTGYFEDELEMMTNASRNLKQHKFALVDSTPRLEQNLPVFIVGAGPSLDRDLEHIRRLRDRAVVISCGTTLGILLKNGIRPDLHCENERGPLVFDLLSEVGAAHGFEGITLLASATVDPRVPTLFDDAWLFFRGALSSTAVLGKAFKPLAGADPLVCNAAFAASIWLGFRNVYLFGVDLAQKAKGQHHAKDSIYYAHHHASLDDLYVKRFDRSVPGNFGGTVETWWAFEMARQTMTWLQLRQPVNLVNCSDGARIDGARPKVAAALTLPDGLPDRRFVLGQITSRLRRLTPGEALADLDQAHEIEGCDHFMAALDETIEAARSAGDGFFELERRLNGLVDPPDQRSRWSAYYFICRGSVRSMLRLGAFFGTRIQDPDERARYFDHFLTCWRQRCGEMATQTKSLLAEIDGDVSTPDDHDIRRRA